MIPSWLGFQAGIQRRSSSIALSWLAVIAAMVTFVGACNKKATPAPASQASPTSTIHVSKSANSITIETPAAEFVVSPDGYVAANLLAGKKKLSLDDPGDEPGLLVVVAGKKIEDFVFDLAAARISEPQGKLGAVGQRVEVNGKSVSTGLEASLAIELSDDFPAIALISSRIRNAGSGEISLDQVDLDRHRLNASLADSAASPNQMWSFHGASIRWGKDNVFEIPKNFRQQNQMGSLVEVKGDLGRVGGGIPVVAFWTRTVGEAIGHVETLPLVLSIPVKTESDGHVDAKIG